MDGFYMDIIVSFIMILFLTLASTSFGNETRKTKKRFDEFPISNKSDCAAYLNTIKSSAIVSGYSLVASIAITLMLFFMMKMMAFDNSKNQIYIIMLFMGFTSFAITYKIYNCFLFRSICGDEFCKA